MRVNPNPLPDVIAALAQTQQQINTDLQQIASGRSVNVPSDNPSAAAELIQNADSTLNSVVTSLRSAISVGVEGANGTLNSADRAALATEVRGIQAQLV